MPIKSLHKLMVFLIAVPLSASCAQQGTADHYRGFVEANSEQVKRYEAHLAEQKVLGVVPTEQLLRNARRWVECSDSPYSIAPQHLWPNQVRTLRLLKELKSAVPLDEVTVRSVYRNSNINVCAGGSKRSQHLHNNAIDFDVALDASQTQALCEFWRTKGREWNMGLGFYSNTALHIDTSGFRTWGYSKSRDSSLCVQSELAKAASK